MKKIYQLPPVGSDVTSLLVLPDVCNVCIKSTVQIATPNKPGTKKKFVFIIMLLFCSTIHARNMLVTNDGENTDVKQESYRVAGFAINDSLPASADDPLMRDIFAGIFRFRTVELSEQDDSLSLKLEMRVVKDALNKRQGWAVVPQLSGSDGDSAVRITFPYALVNGRIREKLYKRRIQFENEALLSNLPAVKADICRQMDDDILLLYSLRIPYEPWMDMAEFKIHGVLLSPAGKRQLFTIENAGRVEFAPRTPYIVQPQVSFTEPEREEKRRRMQGQAYLDFQVGQTVIIPTFRRNPEELSKIAAAVATVKNDPDVQITGLFVEGYASPEGSYALNERLARGRSEALRDYMAKEYGLDRNLFKVNSVPEDWDGLKVLVEESSMADAQKQRVLQIINSNEAPDTKESRLRALGTPWSMMMTEMFPQLRRVDYQINFSVKDYTLEESRSLVGRNPELLSQRELFLLAQNYPAGSKEREEAFDLIVRLYPDDVVAMINGAAMMLSRDENNGAKRLLDKAGNDPRALNNLGVFYLKTGELEQAEACFTKATALYPEAAALNLDEVRKKREDNEKMKRYEK